MSRAVSNLLIVLVMASTATAVLAFSSNTADIPEPGDGARSTEAQDGTAVADESFGDQAVEALKEADGSTEASTDTPPALDTDSTESPAGENSTDVLGATQAPPAQVQETSPAEVLAETGPIEIGQWLVIAVAAIATGGLARNAGLDHREGLLPILP